MYVIWIVPWWLALLILFIEAGPSKREREAEAKRAAEEEKARLAAKERWNSPEEVERRREMDAYIARTDAIRAQLAKDAWVNLG
jgi:hypothetical protein